MAAGDLTDLATVREFMQKGATGTETEQDALITDVITRASRVIQRTYTRIFVPAETNASHTFVWRGRGWLSLSPWYARSVTAVQLDPDLSSPTNLSAGDWSIEPDPAEDGVYTHLRFPGQTFTGYSNLELQDDLVESSYYRRVRLTGDWGYTAVPDDVKHWATVTVVEWIRKDVSAFSTAFDPNEDRLDRPEAIPYAAQRGLLAYKRDDVPPPPVLAAPRSRPAQAI